MSQINTIVEEALGGIDRDLASSITQKQEKFDHWHSKIREAAKARQIEQKQLDALKQKSSERLEIDRRIKNLERSSEGLLGTLKNTPGIDFSRIAVIGDADKTSGVDPVTFEAVFGGHLIPLLGSLPSKLLSWLRFLHRIR